MAMRVYITTRIHGNDPGIHIEVQGDDRRSHSMTMFPRDARDLADVLDRILGCGDSGYHEWSNQMDRIIDKSRSELAQARKGALNRLNALSDAEERE